LRIPGQDGLNPFYDVVFPGQTINFKASGLDLDWYQPLHENGNILSYPGPANGAFSPTDVGLMESRVQQTAPIAPTASRRCPVR